MIYIHKKTGRTAEPCSIPLAGPRYKVSAKEEEVTYFIIPADLVEDSEEWEPVSKDK